MMDLGGSTMGRVRTVRTTVSLFMLALAAIMLAACSAPDPVDPTPTVPTSGVTVVSSGTQIAILDTSDGSLEMLNSVQLEGVLSQQHAVFGLALHPTQPWLFVSSIVHANWGKARIDVYEFTSSGLVLLRTNALIDFGPDDIGCVEEDADYCAITEMAFNAAGTLLYVNEDNNDEIVTFSVDTTTGTLAFVAQGVSVSQQGLTAHPSEPFLYNGTYAIELVAGIPDNRSAGTGGNSTTVVELGGSYALITTTGNSDVRLADLTDPGNPLEVDTLAIGGSGARALSVQASTERVIVVGTDAVTVLGYDETGFTMLGDLAVDPPEGFFERIYRGVAWVGDSDLAVAMWFTNDFGGFGGYTLFEVDEGGSISLVEDAFGAGRARAVVHVP
jgi:hypothetical protein